MADLMCLFTVFEGGAPEWVEAGAVLLCLAKWDVSEMGANVNADAEPLV